jgi:ubiquinone biosynthesis protein COQ9
MSFSFAYAGAIAGVKAQARSHHAGDDTHAARVRDFIRAELEHFPESAWFNGALVEASGHSDANGYNLSLAIRPLHLTEVLPEEDGEDAPA